MSPSVLLLFASMRTIIKLLPYLKKYKRQTNNANG